MSYWTLLVVLDFTNGSANLADGYRVVVRVITWEDDGILTVPSSAVFRSGEEWALFEVSQGRSRKRTVTLGHRGDREIQILQHLPEGTPVILHPGPALKDGSRVIASD